jgi:hypothetical protein
LEASLLDASVFEQAAASVHALGSLKRPLEAEKLDLDAYAVRRSRN